MRTIVKLLLLLCLVLLILGVSLKGQGVFNPTHYAKPLEAYLSNTFTNGLCSVVIHTSNDDLYEVEIKNPFTCRALLQDRGM